MTEATLSTSELTVSEKALFHYIEKGRLAAPVELSVLKQFLADVRPDTRNVAGDTFLHALVKSKQIGKQALPEAIRLLVNHGVNLDATNAMGETPLHALILSGSRSRQDYDQNAVREMIKLGATVDSPDKDGFTPLRRAVASVEAHLVRILVDAGADPKLSANDGKSPLDIAKERGYHVISGILGDDQELKQDSVNLGKVVQEFVEKHQPLREPEQSAARRAVLTDFLGQLQKYGFDTVVDGLLSVAQTNNYKIPEEDFKEQPLWSAQFTRGEIDAIRSTRADPSLKAMAWHRDPKHELDVKSNGFSILDEMLHEHLSSRDNDFNAVFDDLIRRGANPHRVRTSDGVQALHLAAEALNPQAVKRLLAEGVEPNSVNNNGSRALHYAVANAVKNCS